MAVGKLTLAALGLALVVLVVAVAAQEAGEERFILGSRDMEPPLNEWRALNRKPSATDIVRFNVALRQRNVEVLEAVLYEVSDPRSPKYGQHLTSEEILDIVAPAKEDHDVVVEWLHNSGVVSIESARDALKVQATVAQVEQLLQTELYLYQHKGTKGLKIALVGEYSIPASLTPQIALVTGFTEFPRRVDSNRRSHKQRLGASPGDSPYYFVPQVITNLYGVPEENVVINNAGVTQGVVEFEDVGAFMEGDLATFFDGIELPDYNKTVIVGPYAPNGFLESELDIQYIMGIAQNATTYYWTQQGWMYDFALDAFTRKDIPLVFSMSYGWTERSECSLGPGYPVDNCTRSDDYVNRTNVEFMKLGARGVTLLAASGDQGAPGDGNPECLNIFDPLNPLYPAASPYVLSVGATMLDPETGTTQPPKICQQFPCATGGTEVTCAHPVALITSGGGFSVYTPRPSYQDAVIQAYENSDIKKPPSLLYHKDNRGIPDVAGFGHSYLIVSAYQWEIVDGTSCSTPMWGAIVSILNNIRLNQGKSPLGFINPLLYQIYADTNGAAFNDITSGDNKCTEELCCLFGFDAGAGWDPVTGLGSPNVKALIDYVTNMTN